MNRKTLAVAVLAALAAPAAMAQKSDSDSVVTLYGKVYPEFIVLQGRGATAAGESVATIAGTPTGTNGVVRHNEVASSNSRLGVRGYEKLGGNLQAVYQLETAFSVDTTSTFAGRDSFVGLKGGWGEVKLGKFDTPFKTYGDDISFLGVSSGNFTSTSEVLRKTGFGTSSSSSFHLRRTNSVIYETPEIGGFDASVLYSTDEAKTATRDPEVFSAAARFERGPIYLAIAYERHDDLFGGSRNARATQSNFNDQSVNSKDEAVQFTVKYTLGKHVFEFDYNDKKYTENASTTGRFREYRNKAYLVAMDNRWSGQWRTAAHYVKGNAGTCTLVNAQCSTSGLDMQQISVGASYSFSKRTYLFAIFSELRNGKSARGNATENQTVSVGEDVRQAALGIHHSF